MDAIAPEAETPATRAAEGRPVPLHALQAAEERARRDRTILLLALLFLLAVLATAV